MIYIIYVSLSYSQHDLSLNINYSKRRPLKEFDLNILQVTEVPSFKICLGKHDTIVLGEWDL